MSASKSHRSRERVRQIVAQRKQQQAARIQRDAQKGLFTVLDSLNAFGLLEDVQKRPPTSHLCFGPKDVYGTIPDMWAGVVIWYRPAGYYHYKSLHLLGIWVQGTIITPEVIVGTRTLDYTAQFYNAESYFRHIRRSFDIYYGKDAAPPSPEMDEKRLYTTTYDRAQRLAVRREIEAALAAWQAGIQP